VEQLHPFPEELLSETIALYSGATEVVWCQEEPKNQGAWYQIRHHLQACIGSRHQLLYAGRDRSASPAVGKFSVHQKQQDLLVMQALTLGKGDHL
jgi:2-oxoglutarate dehydrogenase E1 component